MEYFVGHCGHLAIFVRGRAIGEFESSYSMVVGLAARDVVSVGLEGKSRLMMGVAVADDG